MNDPTAIVGKMDTGTLIAEFYGEDALKNAEKFVGMLPEAWAGLYYVDWPCPSEGPVVPSIYRVGD